MNEYYPDYNPGLWITACSIFGGSFGVFAGGWLSDRLVKKFGLHSRLWLLSVSTVKFLFNISKSFRQIDFKKKEFQIYSNLDIANKSVRPFLFTISNKYYYIKCNMLSKSSKWELGFV